MAEKLREIWFKCTECEKESYCGGEFGDDPESNVMCPFCRHEMKLDEVRIK
ncbi:MULTISPECIES: hypothetical protein [unclassified Paenibacillus]|uniref:hypothetical protein n=1 Tax=unclassified Paenibacillus TaxID=185978 RepID=UPI001AEB2DEF|nr:MULTISPECIES: hypothetical protein [unclassified Paenibacillus]MBP1157185.1 acetyl-CoA carboxylase beta subunit [Paenibacillus sp. PvP091]MBP1172076.1 acetyl-CoA carboxylase beta subunit [Paenibacillus sp. PvR098]MBP2438457.1 acetyl-CoA carboxylase beta subunit [Paenibacillus sp. PvP052]